MKRNLILIITVAIYSIAGVSSSMAANGLKEGKWSMTMHTQMEGMPGNSHTMEGMQEAQVDISNGEGTITTSKGKLALPGFLAARLGKKDIHMNMVGNGQEVTMTQCITNENPFPKPQENSKCEKPKINRSGNRVDYSMVCNSERGTMEISGHSVFNGDMMQGESKMHGNFSGHEMNMTTQTTGKYLGPC